jgi:SAM-dependent methyltransferase
LDAHGSLEAPSPWVQRWAAWVPRGTEVLDLACGNGRHTKLFAALGHAVCAVDRDADALSALATLGGVRTLQADLEAQPWPLPEARFGAIVVTNYLHRPLFPALLGALAEDGVLIYETFAAGNERFGKPSNPAFLLTAGELLDVVRGRLRVFGFEDLYVDAPKPALVQRLVAGGPQFRPPGGDPAQRRGQSV